ncbi:MAG: hypothetical protein IAF38_22840 [Bacteroidia bacterium]|nr:hypothetical protein [Bacteroidia bacterium]
MKTIIRISTALAIAVSTLANAQVNSKISYGVTGAIGASSVEIGNFGRNNMQTLTSKNIGNLNIGVFMLSQRAPFQFKTGISYCIEQGTITNKTTNNFAMQKIEVPLLLGGNIYGPFVVEVGPVYNYMLKISRNYDSDYNNTQFGRNGLGFRVAAGLDFDKFFLMSNFQRVSFADSGTKNSFRERYQFTLSAGIKLVSFQGRTRIDNKRYSITPGR